MEKVIELATILNQQNEFHEILRIVSQKTTTYLKAETAVIMMTNPRTHQTVKTIYKEGKEIFQSKYRSVQNQICGWLMIHKSSLLSSNIKKDPRFKNVNFADISIKSVIGVPLKIEGTLIGTIILLNKNRDREFDQQDLELLEKIAIISVPYLRNVQKIEEFFIKPLPEKVLLTKFEKMGLIGKSKGFIELLNAIESAAKCDVRVLLEGPTGTGKELIAHAIHKLSDRNQGPFVAIDCGAIPANLLESEFFGYEKGAFTGANSTRKGLIEAANNGTLFLDEIINLPLEMQSKLNRFLQENEIKSIGSNRTQKVNVRIIAAASQSLQDLIDKQKFREDLFYRLYVYPITVPSLSNRQEDVPILANYFLKKFSKQQNKKIQNFHENVLEYLKNKNWVGNIRELENLVERLVTITPSETKVIDDQILPKDIKTGFKQTKVLRGRITPLKSLDNELAKVEKQLIQQALLKNHGNQSQAARDLKVSVQKLRYKMSKLGIVNN